MKIKLLGYNIDKTTFPEALKRSDIYEHISTLNGLAVTKTFLIGTTQVRVPVATGVEKWWGGMSLRIRDAKAFNKMVSTAGKVTLKAEKLEDNEKLAEVNFFVAHPETGSGLFSYYSGSSSLIGFGLGLRRAFADYRSALRKGALKAAPVKDRPEISKKYAGILDVGQLCQNKDLKTLVASLAKVKSCELRLSSVVSRQTLFRGVAQFAKSESVRFALSDDVDPLEFGDAVEEAAKGEEVESIAVRGLDSHGVSQTYKAVENALSFGELDYDSVMGDIRLDLSDWATSIKDSPIIQKLAATAAGNKTHALLSYK